MERAELTLPPSIKLDVDLLVDVFGQIENIFLLGLFVRLVGLLVTTTTPTSAPTAAISAMASSATSSAPSEMTSFGHY